MVCDAILLSSRVGRELTKGYLNITPVPASSPQFLRKTLLMPQVDSLAYDLEDSVIPLKKVEARRSLCSFLGDFKFATQAGNIKGEVAVRINAVGTPWCEGDLREVLKISGLRTLLVPKIKSPLDLKFVVDAIQHYRPQSSTSAAPLGILALIESALALSSLSAICKCSPEHLRGLIFAAEDFALDLSITRTPSLSEFLYARSAIVTEARAHKLDEVIDLVCTEYKGLDSLTRLETECENGRRMGFTGKQCIHPSQVDIVQRVFAPSNDELSWGVRLLMAVPKAEKEGWGAWTLDGKMIDAPVIARARRLVERAKACGVDLEALEKRWQGQEPE